MIVNQNIPTFDAEIVKRGGLIRAKYRAWTDFRNGLVERVEPNRLTVFYQTPAATSHFTVRANEAADGHWEIFYTNDLEETYHVGTN